MPSSTSANSRNSMRMPKSSGALPAGAATASAGATSSRHGNRQARRHSMSLLQAQRPPKNIARGVVDAMFWEKGEGSEEILAPSPLTPLPQGERGAAQLVF